MNNLRFESPAQSWPAAANTLSSLDASGADLQQLASEFVDLATQDPARAVDVLRDVLTLTPPSASSEFAGAVAQRFDGGVLARLAQDPVGRDLVALLERFGNADVRGLMQTARDAGSARTAANADWSWAGSVALAVRSGAAPARANSGRDTADAERVKGAFKEEFAAKAANKEEFDAFMQQVYGDKYDKGLAEQYRQMALRGDFSFLPEVKFVDASTLQGGKGAYNEAEGVVYINRDIAASNPGQAAQVFVEEAGAHLDAKLNTVDTQGDEGEMFRRVLSGEQLSQHEIDAIRNDDDHGTITVDGKQVQVEFWFGEDIVDAASDAVDTVKDAASDVGDWVEGAGESVKNAAYEVGDAFKDVGTSLFDGTKLFLEGVVVDGLGGWTMNMLQGNIADAFDSAARGLDKAILQAPRRMINGALEGAGHLLKTSSYLFPQNIGNLWRDVVDRGVDSVRSVVNGAIDIARTCVRTPLSIIGGFAQDMGAALKYWARGDIGEGFERFGMAFVNPFKKVGGAVVDSAMIFFQAGTNVVGNVSGQHYPSRGLSNEERDYLKTVYGDSLNLDDIRVHRGNLSLDAGIAPHTVGNDIYLPDRGDYFKQDGTLTDEGKLLLAHEAFHVYQSQHEGNGYIHESLEAQGKGEVSSGDRGAAYDFTVPLHEGKPFNEWNPEQQAEFIETMKRAKTGTLTGTTDVNGDGTKDTSFDYNGNGKVDAFELNMAWLDHNGDGKIDDKKFARVWLNDEDMARANGIWQALQDDRPDLNLV